MAKTGLEIIKALDTTAGEIAEIISKGHPPFENGGAVVCDLVTTESRTDDGGGYFLCSFEGGDRISES